MTLKSKITSKVSGIQAKRKAAEAEKQKHMNEKIKKMKQSIQNFKEKLCENFILGGKMSEEFKNSFKSQLEKQGSSATKRWCQDVAKKLAKLDESNKKFLSGIAWTGSEKASCNISLRVEDKEFITKKTIEEFGKIFYTTTRFDSALLGIDLKVKPTFSQKAAVNSVRKELDDLCEPENFKPKA